MLILHIGLPKTGTTFLQKRVFPSAKGLRYSHRRLDGPEAGLALAFRAYAHAHPLTAPPRRALLRRLNVLAGVGQPLLVSDENISLSATGFRTGQGASPADFAARLQRLAAGLDPRLLPVRIILGIRRQDQWLASRYAESHNARQRPSQADFDRRAAALAAAPETVTGPFAWLDYAATHATLAAAFGLENLLILPLERITEAPAETVATLSAFLGDALPAKPRKAEAMSRKPSNRLSLGEDHWRMRDGGELRLSPALADALRARYADSNAALAEILPLGF